MTRILRHPLLWVLVIAATSAGSGYWFARQTPPSAMASPTSAPDKHPLYWYDPMVPDQHFDKPGKSPFMDMQLLPKYADSAPDAGISIPAGVAQNLGIRLATVEKTGFSDAISAVGRLEADEHKLYSVQPLTTGFIRRLYIRAIGDQVHAGQKIAELYSPELLAAQQEYLVLLKQTGIADVEALSTSARQRLHLLGMADSEINAISKTGQANATIGIYAPASGVVTELLVREGAQTQPGTNLMQISDLSALWLMLDIPEREASILKTGDVVETQLESLPGQRFSGKIDYLYPSLDTTTRSLRVRVALANAKGQLRPGMLATAMVNGASREVITVPSEAVISTGKRQLVIVKVQERFQPVEIRLGQERNGQTEILQGLQVGERVVVSGQFLIDSEASLNGVLARLTNSSTASPSATNQSKAKPMTANTGVRAKVVALDLANASVTLDHEAIPALDWPPMTMTFKVRHPDQLNGLKAGDQVRIEVNTQPEGDDYVIDQLHKESAP